jgi:hypothetical protein
MDGKQQHTYQYDSNKHRLFTGPARITTNNNKDIVVVTDFTRNLFCGCDVVIVNVYLS